LRDSIISLLLYLAGGGVIGMFVGAISIGDPIGVLIAALVVGILSATIRFIILLNRALSRIAGVHVQPSIAQASNESGPPNVDARVAFYDILANSHWSQQERTGVDRPRSNWLAERLDQEIHNLLRQSKLKAWGHSCLTTTVEGPEREISANEWENIEIDFAALSPQLPRTSAIWRVRRGGFNTVYAGVRFSRDQIYSCFPLIQVTATPTPGGVQPDWPIRELFFHIRPDLLENPSTGFIVRAIFFSGNGRANTCADGMA
jgi:hypothetical protein